MATSRICTIPGCGKRYRARGWCGAHYERWREHGDPSGGSAPRGSSAGSAQRYFRDVVLNYDGDECLIWPHSRDGGGYGHMQSNGRPQPVSRLVCEAVNGPPPTLEHDAAHSCGKGHEGCVTRRHLSWKTTVENMADKLIHGTHNRGERHPKVKLTESQVREVRKMKGTQSQYAIAKKFGVGVGTIRCILTNTTWVWLE